MLPGAALWSSVLAAYLVGAAALRAKAGSGDAACTAVLERLLPAPARAEEDLVKLCISVFPEAVCRAAYGEVHQGDGSAQNSVIANVTSGAACHAVEVALQGWRRSRAGPAGAATRLSAVSLDQSLQKKAFEWERRQEHTSASWIDQLVERVHKLHRTYAESEGDLPAWVRDLSQYVTTSEIPKPTPVEGANAVARVTGSMRLAISDLDTFVVDPNMREVVRGGIADVANVPAAYIKANMTLPTAGSNKTSVDYAIEIPLLDSNEAAASTAIEGAIAALMNQTAVIQEVSDFMSASVESWLGPGIYTISVLNVTRPTFHVRPT